jgi:predicted regulator of Ras-like GTPase activity (Roadblock/LC7/MglB family)
VVLFVTAAGPGAVLAVLAGRDADAGVLGYEMGQLVKRVPSYLATPARHAVATPGHSIR